MITYRGCTIEVIDTFYGPPMYGWRDPQRHDVDGYGTDSQRQWGAGTASTEAAARDEIDEWLHQNKAGL